MEDEINYEEREELSHILGNPPSGTIRLVMGMMAGFVAVLVGLAWWMRYPDVLHARVMISTATAPLEVKAMVGAKIETLFVANGDSVQPGTRLALMSSTARLADVDTALYYASLLAQLTEPTRLLALKIPANLALGENASGYGSLRQRVESLQYTLRQTSIFQKIAAIEREIAQTKTLNGLLEQQRVTLQTELTLSQKNYDRTLGLHAEKVMTDVDLEKAEAALLQAKRQLESLKTSEINNAMRIEQLSTSLLDLRQNRADNVSGELVNIRQEAFSLEAALRNWLEQWVITAAIPGQATFSQPWSTSMVMKAGESFCTLVPRVQQQKVVGRALLPRTNAGKIALGQRANLHLDGFPANEYGFVTGKVTDIAAVPADTAYWLTLELPDTLRTSFGKVIPPRQNLTASAEIITEDRRLLMRLFDGMRYLLDSQR